LGFNYQVTNLPNYQIRGEQDICIHNENRIYVAMRITA
jgi:hypothetical protein